MILGIDPGLHGAVALYDPATNTIVSAGNIPVFFDARNRKKRLTLDIPSLVRLIHGYAKPGVTACLELVGGYRVAGRRQGGSSMFSFGKTAGAIETALVAAGIPFSKVMPGVWKRALDCPADKDETFEVANRLLPKSVEHWTPRRKVRTKKQCEGIVEAALIGLYGSRLVAS